MSGLLMDLQDNDNILTQIGEYPIEYFYFDDIDKVYEKIRGFFHNEKNSFLF